MRQSLHRAAYRVAHPVLAVLLAVTRIQRRGAKCVLFEGGEVLLVRHTYGDRKRWDLPGGIVGRNEEPAAAARRELREELGVEGVELRPLGPRLLEIHGRRDDVHYFQGVLATRELRRDPIELAETGWFALDALPAPLGRQVRDVLEQALGSGDQRPGSP